MKKYTVHIILVVVIIVLAVVIGCKYFNKEDSSVSSNSMATSEPVATATQEPTPTVEPTEPPHEHAYSEAITTEATCETDGVKTFTCDCGDSYTEVITATGHNYGEYISNNDATYTADGTETATCVCGLTDTRTAEGSKLEYTFQSIGLIMYAQQTVNVRDLPCTDGEKIGSLSMNEEVIVLRQCIETGWYEIQHITDGYIGYVSDSYLGTSKVTSSSGNADENYVTPETDNPSNGNPGGSGGNSGGGTTMRPGGTDEAGDGGNTVGDAVINP